MSHIVIRNYDTEKYNFAYMLQNLYNVKNLNQVHILDPELCAGEWAAVRFDNEVKTYFHQVFYGKLREPWKEFVDAYNSFVENEIAPLFDEDFVYQTTPSFRVQVPNNKAVSLWHCDSDERHLHPLGEINFIVPMTKAFDTNATWAESAPGKKDFKPMEMEYGQFAQFNGNQCLHGNKINQTGISRVSFDFRIMPMSKYTPELWNLDERANSRSAAGTTPTKFLIGDYYSLYKKVQHV
jgi:hypothetical protein|tara:strand:+ start:2169 stop:2882 length:714 start_codon:yes stop_codon:yes gene_type:complete